MDYNGTIKEGVAHGQMSDSHTFFLCDYSIDMPVKVKCILSTIQEIQEKGVL